MSRGSIRIQIGREEKHLRASSTKGILAFNDFGQEFISQFSGTPVSPPPEADRTGNNGDQYQDETDRQIIHISSVEEKNSGWQGREKPKGKSAGIREIIEENTNSEMHSPGWTK